MKHVNYVLKDPMKKSRHDKVHLGDAILANDKIVTFQHRH